MRTTLTLDDQLAEELKEIAHRTGRPFKTVVNEALRAGLSAQARPSRKRRYRLRPASLGQVLPGFNLDKALALADTLEEQELARKLELRK